MTQENELQRILKLQRDAFLSEGPVSLESRRDRVSRMALAILENIDAIADALSEDYGNRPSGLTKSFESLPWAQDTLATLNNLEEWMAPIELQGGFVQQKPKGVVGIIGAWNFPVLLTFEPAMAALAAGNRVMLNFTEFHKKLGALLSDIFGKAFREDEVAFIQGDLQTAQAFSKLQFDHLFFTGSPKVGSLVSAEAGKNLVPVTMELGGKNPVVVARDADIGVAAGRVAAGRMLNSGQICLCPDYAFVPKEHFDDFLGAMVTSLKEFFPTYLNNPNVVSIVNDRNYQRITGLITDAVSKGARKIEIVPTGEEGKLPDPATRRIPPTILVDVPGTADIASEEVFGPVLVLYPYEDINEALSYIAQHPTPLAAYWHGEDSAEFRNFLEHTNSGGVTRNDVMLHALLPDAPFGGCGQSGSGAYHGKAGFDTFTHRRTVANFTQEQGVANALVDGSALTPEALGGVDAAVQGVIGEFKKRLA